MPSLKVCLAAASLACIASAETIKVIATSGNTFTPDIVRASVGDMVEFHFQPANHSVVSGDYENPCSPMQLGNGFYSGFQASPGGEAGKIFRVKVNNKDPMPFYSSQGDECPKGMVGMINPVGNRSLDSYRSHARSLTRSVTPGSASYGGELIDNPDPSVQRNQDGTVKAASGGSIALPAMGLVLAMSSVALCL